MSDESTALKTAFKPSLGEAQRRQTDRIEVRRSEGMSAIIEFSHEVDPVEALVYDISIEGVSLVMPNQYRDQLQSVLPHNITIKCSWGYTFEGRYVCSWVQEYRDNQIRVGFRSQSEARAVGFVPSSIADSAQIEIPAQFPIVGYLYKDFFYVERSAFQIESISKKKIKLLVSESEILVFVGLKIELIFALHATSGLNLVCQVDAVEVLHRKSVRIEATILEFPEKLEFDTVNHLLQNTNVSPENLRAAGFKVKSIANNFRFRIVRSHEEYVDVLALRRSAYVLAGKMDPQAHLERMVAPLDKMSRILAVYHGDRIIGSVAMSFPDSEDIVLDTEKALEGGYPPEFPKKTSVIEIARLCTDPAYRRGDLLLRIFEHMYKIFVTSGREYLLSSTDDKLWPIYKNLGFWKTGHTYAHPFLAGLKHSIILIRKEAGTHGRGIGPLRWNYLYRNMSDFMEPSTDLGHSRWDRLVLLVYRAIGRLLKIRPNQRY